MAIPGKLALFLPDLGGGGAERVFLSLADEFSRRGIHAELVVCRSTGEYTESIPSAVQMIDLGYKLKSGPGILLGLYSVLKLAGYLYCVLSTLTGANLALLMAGRLAGSGTKIIIREANTILNIGVVYRWLARLLYPQASLVIAVSDGVAEDLEKKLSVPKDKISVINNPVDMDRINDLTRQDTGHAWLAGNPGKPVILAIGRLVPQKDFHCLLRAFALVRGEMDCRLIILGEGRQRKALLRYAGELGISDALSLPGFSPRPFSFLERASVFVLSSRWEGFPNVLLQALAAGTPVVATDCHSGPREILQNGRYGELVPVGESRSLAEALLRTLKSPPPEKSFLQQAVTNYRPDRIATMYIKAIAGQ